MITSEKDGERLSDAELISTTVLLLNAGHEATVHQIGNAVRTILQSGLSPAGLFSDEKATERTPHSCACHRNPARPSPWAGKTLPRRRRGAAGSL
jgi:cytochrome P450